jgi:hypothetical protein
MKLIYLLTSLTAMALAAPSPLGEYVCHREGETCVTIAGPIGVCCPGLQCVYIGPDLGVSIVSSVGWAWLILARFVSLNKTLLEVNGGSVTGYSVSAQLDAG